MDELSVTKKSTLPIASWHRLERLAQRWRISPDRALAHLIDAASRELSIADWEAAQADGFQGAVSALLRFKRQLQESPHGDRHGRTGTVIREDGSDGQSPS